MPRKNIDLDATTIRELTKMAEENGNKFKPYVEWRLTELAKKHKGIRLNHVSDINDFVAKPKTKHQ